MRPHLQRAAEGIQVKGGPEVTRTGRVEGPNVARERTLSSGVVIC